MEVCILKYRDSDRENRYRNMWTSGHGKEVNDKGKKKGKKRARRNGESIRQKTKNSVKNCKRE
jgi:hypothetical protein